MAGIDPRLTSKIRKYDPALYVYVNKEGKSLIMRQAGRAEDSDYGMEEMDPSCLHPQLILALTDNWKCTGSPVEWGIEPILSQLRSMDSWRDDKWLPVMRKNREKADEIRLKDQKNLFRDVAGELRGEFARATNDINTSTLEKVDRRRNHGNR